MDNAMVEVFKNSAAVTTLNNPNPTLSEVVAKIGDYNNDGKVDAADYTVWRDHLGQTFTLPNRDPVNTGAISNSDYTSWKNHFGASRPWQPGRRSGAGAKHAVPDVDGAPCRSALCRRSGR